MRDTIARRGEKEEESLGWGTAKDEEKTARPTMSVAPDPRAETRRILVLMVFLSILGVWNLRQTAMRPARVEKKLPIVHAFVASRHDANASEHDELRRLKRQLAALGVDDRRVTVAFRDEAQPNASRPLDAAAAAAGSIEGVLTYRSLTTKLASWASRSHPDPVVILVKEQAVVTAGGAAIVDEAIKFLESGRAGGWDALFAGHCGECGWWTSRGVSSSAAPLGAGLERDGTAAAAFAERRARRVGCGHTTPGAPAPTPGDVARAVRRRAVAPLGGDSAVLAAAVDPRCAPAVVLRYTPRMARLLATAATGGGTYGNVVEPRFDLTLARMAEERVFRSFVIWPPVVHSQVARDAAPNDGYGGNSTRFIEAWLNHGGFDDGAPH